MPEVGTEDLSLDAKIDIAKIVIKEGLRRSIRPAVFCDFGRDGMVLLHLIRHTLTESNIELMPLIFIDHNEHFPETLEFLEIVRKNWGLSMIVAKNEDAIIHIDKETKLHVDALDENNRSEIRALDVTERIIECHSTNGIGKHLLRTVPLLSIAKKYRIDTLFSFETLPGKSGDGLLTFFDLQVPGSMRRVSPLLLFRESDSWNYLFKFKVPIHPLYSKGYSNVDSRFADSQISDTPPWSKYAEATSAKTFTEEDEKLVAERLKRLGYM